ncbi:methylthioribulose 1-phosphate dehydratase [Algiphilus aromaticivorans]|uniref:methylthioribulose 1-phosphate dehydratase n=1 Tax=Algiphilus aromaticivorans TaxID=382454 RepID=UPI000AABDF92|nr:methylthioribulose 1-phosphate dehydratase [Algiphilus aromaticivorans]
MDVAAITDALISAGHLLHQRGWVPASGGNFSARIGSDRFLMTASGCHKGELTPADFLVVDGEGTPQQAHRPSSAETLLHCAVYRHFPAVGAVLHTHSVPATLLSRAFDDIQLADYELLKILEGITTHKTSVAIPVFDNDQNIARLAAVVEQAFADGCGHQGFLIRGHGLYAWGQDVPQARYRVEALEFLFDCQWQSQPGRHRSS